MWVNRSLGRVVLGTLVLAIVAVLFVTPPAHAAASELRVSTNADRTNHRELSGAAVTGNIFVFWNGPKVRSVTFVVDPWWLGLNGSSLRSVERIAPYDLAHTAPDGRAYPFDTEGLSPGRHSLLVIVRKAGGGTTFRAASFSVKRDPSAPAPTPTASPTTSLEPTPTAEPTPSATVEPTPTAEPTPSASVEPTPTAEPSPTSVEPTNASSPLPSG